MTILYAVGEPADITGLSDLEKATFLTSTSTAYHESGVSRLAMYKYGGAATVYSPLNATASELWVHFKHRPRTSTTSYPHVGNPEFGVADASNNLIAGIKYSGGIYSAGSIFHSDFNLNIYNGPLVDWDVHVFMDAVVGFIRWYKAGVLVYEFSGDTRGAVGDASSAAFGQMRGNIYAGYESYLSQVIVSTQPTIGAKLYTVAPVAIGADAQWAGAVTDVNHIGINDATSISTDVVGNRQSFTITPPASLPVGLEIAAIRTTFRGARDAASAINNVQPYFKVGGTNYNAGAAFALPTLTGATDRLIATNPATGLPWELADLTGFEIGFEATA